MSNDKDWADAESERLLPCNQTPCETRDGWNYHGDACPAFFRTEIAQALREARAQGQPTVDVGAVAKQIAETVSKAWPNGYNHRDHFPQAVTIINKVLTRHLRTDESRAGLALELTRIIFDLRADANSLPKSTVQADVMEQANRLEQVRDKWLPAPPVEGEKL